LPSSVTTISTRRTAPRSIGSYRTIVRYYWLDTGAGEGASFGVFDDKAGADESVRLAADFVRTHMAKLLREKPEVIEGPIKAHD
jgi:hypothetical protein